MSLNHSSLKVWVVTYSEVLHHDWDDCFDKVFSTREAALRYAESEGNAYPLLEFKVTECEVE